MLYVVCVDSQQEVLESVLRDLLPLSDVLRVEDASDEEDCLSLLAQLHEDGENVAILLADRELPGGSGLELLAAIAANPRYAATRRVILTSCPQDSESLRAEEQGIIHAYLEKPWHPDELRSALQAQLKLYLPQN